MAIKYSEQVNQFHSDSDSSGKEEELCLTLKVIFEN